MKITGDVMGELESRLNDTSVGFTIEQRFAIAACVEAVAPKIAAQALRDYANKLDTNLFVGRLMREEADAIERGEEV